MHRSSFAILGLVLHAQFALAVSDDINCLESNVKCNASEQLQQESANVQGETFLINSPNKKFEITDLKLSTKDIDELFLSNTMEKNSNQFKPDPRSSQEVLLSSRDFYLGQNIARAARIDCRQKYVRPDPNLLLIVPLLVETVSDTGCKW